MIRGSCLCGGIRYEITGELLSISNCHCRMCQKAHGAAFASYAEAKVADLRVTHGQELISRYRSSPEAQRSFCSRCGSNLFFEPDETPNLFWVAAGGFDSEIQLRPSSHIFIDSKAPWFEINDDLPQHPRDSD